jgi:hypothetical protein
VGPIYSAAIWFFILCLLMYALHEIYGPILRKKILKILILPGLVSMLVFKILACYLVNAKVQDTKLIDDDKEILTHTEPKTGWFGNFVIAVVPFFCMLLLFCLVNELLGAPAQVSRPLPGFDVLWANPGTFFSQFFNFMGWFFSGMIEHGIERPVFWLMLGLGVNLLLSLAPTLKDFKYIALAGAILFGIVLLFNMLGLGFTERTKANVFLLGNLVGNVRFLLGLGFLWLGASVVLIGAYRIYLNSTEGDGKKKK